VQRQALDLVRSVIHTAPADHQGVAVWHVSTLQRVTNVKYALSTFLQDRRTEPDVSRAPNVMFPALSHLQSAQRT